MNKKRLFFSFLCALFIIVCNTKLSSQDLVILHTNDVHSHIEPLSSGRNVGYGGFLRRANYINNVRENHKNVLLLDAGDYNQGTPYYTMFGGELEVLLYNAMGYEAVCLGNHEFDDGQEALANRLKKANYITLCANYNFENTPLDGLIKPYTIIYKDDIKIGIIGVLLNLRGYVSSHAIKGLVYQDPVKIVNKLAYKLKKRDNCDLVIVLSHLGFEGGNKERPSDTYLAKRSKYVDIIIGGHSHTFLKEPVIIKNRHNKGVLINQAGAHGVFVGRLDVDL
jgi:5'-nucleotidase